MVSLNDFESKTVFNRFRKHRFVNEKRLKSYPTVKNCRLGVNQEAKGLHIGSFLSDFIKSYFVVDNKTGCRFLTVDAYAAATRWHIRIRWDNAQKPFFIFQINKQPDSWLVAQKYRTYTLDFKNKL